MVRALLATLAIAALTGCPVTVEPSPTDGPLYFEVEHVGTPAGLDPAAPAPFQIDARAYALSIRAIGRDREPMAWDGDITVHATPGELASDPVVRVRDGEVQTTVRVAKAFDELRIWISDEGDGDGPGSYATGAAAPVHVDKPTISQLQEPEGSDDESPLTRQYVPIRAYGDSSPREVIVTTVSNDGFYVTDRDSPDGSYNSLFVFTFSRPDAEIEVGARLNALAGIVSEFIGYTEMQFPTYEVESRGHSPGEPIVLDPSIVCDDDVMEGYEASVVRVNDLTSDFRRASDCEDYADFGQWPALLPGSCGGGDARVSVVNINTVPSFRFDCDGGGAPPDVELDYLIGVLRHTAPADPPWIVDVRSCLDFPEEHRPADCPAQLDRPMSGPRKAPDMYYRDLVTCTGVPYSLHDHQEP